MPVIIEDVRITISFEDDSTLVLTSKDIYGNVSVSSQSVNGNYFSVGTTCSKTLNFVARMSDINPYDLFGAKIMLEVFLGGSWEQTGIFNVYTAKRNRDIITVSATDNMFYLDYEAYEIVDGKKVSLITQYLATERSLYDLLVFLIETQAGLEFGNTEAEIEAMPNGTLKTIAFQEIQTVNVRDWVGWCAEFMGGFVTTDKYGKIRIEHYEHEPTITISQADIKSDTTDIAGFKLQFSVCHIECFNGDWARTYYEDELGKFYAYEIQLEENQVAQGNYWLTKNGLAFTQPLADEVDLAPTRPFSAQVVVDELLKIGQCISIQDYDGIYYTTVITNHTWSLHNPQQISCIGSDIRLISQDRKRSAVKRVDEQLTSKIKNIGKDVTQAELDQLEADGKIVEGQTYYIYEE